MRCYCCSGKNYSECCQPFLSGAAKVPGCEQLMRSRYSAYCTKNTDYIYQTYHPDKRTDNPVEHIAAFALNSHFIALEITSAQQNSTEGYVNFTVCYIQAGTLQQFSEISRFVFTDQWYYLDGKLTETAPQKIGRNDLCPCNSGKKFKQCSVHQQSGF